MKRYIIFASVVLALNTVPAFGDWVYLGEWGTPGAGDGEFNGPAGVAVASNGNVYVCDVLNHRVQYFTSDGSYIGKWGSLGTGDGQFNKPYGITIMNDGDNIYVADSLNHRIQYFTPSGSFLGKWGTKGSSNGQFNSPRDVGYEMTYRRVYVADSMNHRVQYFRTTGSYMGKWADPATVPTGIAIQTKTGSVYVSDGESRIIRLRPNCSYVGRWSIPQGSPAGLSFMPDGSQIFVACETLHQCHYFTPTGSLLGSWGSRGSGKGQFRRPWGVSVPQNGKRVYVSDVGGNRVQYFRWSDPAVAPESLGRVKGLFK